MSSVPSLRLNDGNTIPQLDNDAHPPDDARRAFDRTLAELGFDYVDLSSSTGRCRRATAPASKQQQSPAGEGS